MGRFKDNKLLAAVVIILIAAGPLLWFSTWLQKYGESEVSVAASWTLGNVDVQIGRAVAVLDELAERGVSGCEASQVAILRRRLLSAGPVKELSVVGIHGQTLCTDRGDSTTPREVIASAPTANPAIVLDIVQLEPGDERMLRVRRLVALSPVALTALIPAELLLPRVAPDGTRFNGYARIALADDTVIGTVGADPDAERHGALVASRVRSEPYGLAVTTAMARNVGFARYDMRLAAALVTGLIALTIVVVALILPRRESHPFYDIERAIGAGELVPYYQPIVDIRSGAIVGAEVLVRWRKHDGTLVLPTTFVPLLEATDLIFDMTRSIMRQVSEEVGPLLEHRPHMYVAFNIAPRHFTGERLIDDIASVFVGGPLSTSQIVLELTERYQIEDLAATRKLIADLQGLSCRVAIDDVGTGHNGLSYILKLGVDIIKIDKMFVDAIGSEVHSQAILDTLVDLARNLRMQIVAEGVETFEQVVYLRDHGISSAQGYVFSPPLPGAAFVQLIEAIDPPVPKAPRAVITGEAASGVPREAAAA